MINLQYSKEFGSISNILIFSYQIWIGIKDSIKTSRILAGFYLIKFFTFYLFFFSRMLVLKLFRRFIALL